MLVRSYPPQSLQFTVTTDPPGSSNKRARSPILEDQKTLIYPDAPISLGFITTLCKQHKEEYQHHIVPFLYPRVSIKLHTPEKRKGTS